MAEFGVGLALQQLAIQQGNSTKQQFSNTTKKFN
jgi:hypothetical protein